MNVRVLLVTRFRHLSMKVAASNRGALTIVHVAWLSDAIRRLKQNNFQAVMVDLDLPDAKGLEALHALTGAAPHLPILVLGNDTVLQQMKMVDHGAHDYLLKHRLDADTLMRALHGSIARKAREGVMFSEKKRAQFTINSIGDGVLSTDNAGLITFLNPVAERLIGWTYAEAAGRHLMEVFQVVEATTRERVVPRMESKMQKGRTVVLLPNCLLVRRDGHESPIEDYAALLYDRSNHISGMVVVFHEVTEARAMAHKLAHPAEHDVLNHLPNQVLPDNGLKQCIARAPTQNKPVDSGECRSLLSLGQQRWPWRFPSPLPRALS
jgi:PAS domain S-box-containing protein